MNSKKDHWQNIYKTRDHKQVGWYQQSPEISLQMFTGINAQPSQSVIDVGCGASVLVDNLIARGFTQITLLDLSDEALSLTRSRLGDRAHIPQYLCEDITSSSFDGSFDIWHDRAVFHFLTDTRDRNNYMSTLQNSLAQKGSAIIGTFSLHGPNACSGLDVVQYSDEKMEKELPQYLQLVSSVSSTHVMPSGSTQEYIYFIIRHNNA